MPSNGNVEIRLADADFDRRSLDVLFAAMVRHYYPDRLCTPGEIGDQVAEIVIKRPGCEVLIAHNGAKPVGFATFSVLFPANGVEPELFMRDLFVVPDARSMGVGEQLMKSLARLAVDRGCVRLDWTTDDANTSAKVFYDRLGATRLPQKVYFRLQGSALIDLVGRASR